MYHHVGARLTISWAMWGAWSKESSLDERMFLRHYGHPQSLDLSGACHSRMGIPQPRRWTSAHRSGNSHAGRIKKADHWRLSTTNQSILIKCSWLLHPSAWNCIHSLWRCMQYAIKARLSLQCSHTRGISWYTAAFGHRWWGWLGEATEVRLGGSTWVARGFWVVD